MDSHKYCSLLLIWLGFDDLQTANTKKYGRLEKTDRPSCKIVSELWSSCWTKLMLPKLQSSEGSHKCFVVLNCQEFWIFKNLREWSFMLLPVNCRSLHLQCCFQVTTGCHLWDSQIQGEGDTCRVYFSKFCEVRGLAIIHKRT